MDCRVLLCFAVIFSSHVLAYRIDKQEKPNDSFYDDDDYEYTYDDEPDKENAVDTKGQNNNITTPKTATYEVTEDVVDIPNPSTKFGPTITNYTTPRPLNNASSVNVGNLNGKPQIAESSNNGLSNTDHNDNEDIKGKKNYYSILHVKAEYDTPGPPMNYGVVDHVHHRLGIKDYIYGISKGIYNTITRLFNKRGCDDNVKQEFRTDDYEETHKFRSESSEETNGFHEFPNNYD